MTGPDRGHPGLHRVLVCPDSFKGTISAIDVAHHLARGLEQVTGVTADQLPLADGGEGTIVALTTAGSERLACTVAGPLGEPIAAQVARIDHATWMVEASSACGLHLLPGGLRPRDASTAGIGELILAAARAGARHVLLAAGGTSTTDGGAGAAEVLRQSRNLPAITVLCDTKTPFESAAAVFGPQKGASPVDVDWLESRLCDVASGLPRDPRGVPFTGAAGGLAGGLWAEFGAELVSGAAYVLDHVNFAQRATGCSLVVTGEGQADHQSLTGKLVGAVSHAARSASVPLALVVGRSRLTPAQRRRLGTRVVLEATDADELVMAGRTLAHMLAGGPMESRRFSPTLKEKQ